MTHRTLSLLALTGALFVSPQANAQQPIRLSTTTSTENSGLLAFLLPAFEAKTGEKVHVIAVGTGKALELAKNGDVDVTLVHARQAEDKFVSEGHGIDRRDGESHRLHDPDRRVGEDQQVRPRARPLRLLLRPTAAGPTHDRLQSARGEKRQLLSG